jgi:serine protease Do
MTGWLVATAIAGAVTLSPAAYGQAAHWKVDSADWDLLAEQAVSVFRGSGGRIGVTVRDLSEEDIKGGKSAGVAIDEIESDSPAAKAGFKAGDVVVEFDGERVRSSRQFARLVQETAPGRSISAAVMRDGQRVTLNVAPREASAFHIMDRPNDFTVVRPKVVMPKPMLPDVDVLPKIATVFGSGRLGITVDDLSPQLAEYFGTKDGVLVKSVNDGSAASKAGLKAGDVITSIDGESVTSAEELRRRSAQLDSGDEFTLGVVRDKKTLSLKGKIETSSRRPRTRTIL